MSKLPAELRRDQIVNLIEERTSATAEELCRAFGVSLMTIWRDLAALEEDGRVRRVRGGTRCDRARVQTPGASPHPAQL